MQLSAASETSFTEGEALEESDVFQGGVVSAPDYMTLHKVSMQNGTTDMRAIVVATWNYRWLPETSADDRRNTSSIRKSSKLSETLV